MATCVAKREGKLIDARFERSLSERERHQMEDHLTTCGWCRERYRKLQLVDRVAAFGADGELDQPAPMEIDRIARDLGLFEPPPRRRWFTFPIFGAAASVAAVALMAVLFLRPPAPIEEELAERGVSPSGLTFAAYAIAPSEGPRLLDDGARVHPTDHLKLRMSGGEDLDQIRGIEVLMVKADRKLEHIHLDGPKTGAETASIPGAIALHEMPPGPLTIYVIHSDDFRLSLASQLASMNASPQHMATMIGKGASVERIDLVLEDR